MKNTAMGLLWVMLGCLALVGDAAARWAVPMIEPGASEWGCSLRLSEVKQGIKSGMAARGWTTSKESPNHILAKVVVRGKHTLIVDIDYGRSNFSIRYKDSINLKYSVNSSGVAKIHPNANSWMDNLKNDISNALRAKCS